MMDLVFLKLQLESAVASPARILPAVVGQHLFGWVILGCGPAIHFNDVLRCLALKQLKAGHIPGVIIYEADEVGVSAPKTEGEDVCLPELIRRCPLEESGTRDVALWLPGRIRHQACVVQCLADGLGACRKKEGSPQKLRDAFDTKQGICLLELDDLVFDRQRKAPAPAVYAGESPASPFWR